MPPSISHELQLRFFDYWLKGIDNGFTSEAPIRIFTMGPNRWRDEREWPPAGTRDEPWFLGPGGTFARERPAPSAPPSRFVYDPRRPVPLPPLSPIGARDWRKTSERSDVLTFTSAALDRDNEITGQILAHLWIESTCAGHGRHGTHARRLARRPRNGPDERVWRGAHAVPEHGRSAAAIPAPSR